MLFSNICLGYSLAQAPALSYFGQSKSPFHLSQWGWSREREVQISRFLLPAFPFCFLNLNLSRMQCLLGFCIKNKFLCSKLLFSVLQMKFIFPCCKTSLKVNLLWRNIKLIFHLYYNGAPYTDVQYKDILLLPGHLRERTLRKFLELCHKHWLAQKESIGWEKKKNLRNMQRRGMLMGTPLKARHYASKGMDLCNIYKGPGKLYFHCFQVGNWNSERLSHLPVWSHYTSYIEEMGLESTWFHPWSTYFSKTQQFPFSSPTSTLTIRNFKRQIWHDFTLSGQLLCLIAVPVGAISTHAQN